jgi:transposase InsO family protein
MTLVDSIQAFRLRVLNEAQRSGNVSATCRRYGISRTLFYRWQGRLEQYGRDGLIPKRRGPHRGRPPRVSVQDERRVIATALAWPTCGPQFVSDLLAREGVPIAAVTVWRVLTRHGLGTRRARLGVLEADSAAASGVLTERTRRRRKTRHVAANVPGELLSLDTFYVGKLKGVGKVWQITGCDVASSYTWAQLVVGEVTGDDTWRFVDTTIHGAYRAAGWELQRVLTDRGHEFKGAFVAGCERHGIRVTRTKPRHAWTNGFVERVQGTILHEHWRIAFRRQYFTSAGGLQRSLDRYLRFYNVERPHRGYRLNGLTPATKFAGATAA